MLSLIRNNVQSFFVKFVVGIVALVMLTFGVVSYNTGPTDSIANVDGLEVKLSEFQREMDRAEQDARRKYGSQADAYIEAVNLPSQIMNQLVNNAVLVKGAEQYGLRVTDLEVARAILTNPNFQTDQRFNEKKYHNLLENNNLSNITYENSLRNSLQAAKVIQFFGDGPSVSKGMVAQEYQRFNTTMQIDAIELTVDRLKPNKKTTEAELKRYYEEHTSEFKQKPMYVLDYFFLTPTDFIDGINVREKEIKKYYEKNLTTKFTTKDSFHARHILIPVEKNADEKSVKKAKEKAEKIYREIVYEKKSFAKLAKKHSSDPVSGKKGGDLGWVEFGTIVEEFENSVRQLSPKEISKPVLSVFGYHIIELLDQKQAKTQKLEDVQDGIVEIIKARKADRRLKNKIARTFKNLDGLTLSTIAEEMNKTVVRSEGIDDNSVIETIGYTGTLYNEISLKQEKELGSLQMPGNSGILLYEIVSISEETTKPFEAVKFLVESTVSKNKAQEFFQQQIAEISQSVSTKEQFKKLSKKLKLPVKESEFKLSDSKVPSLDIGQPFQEEVFNMEQNKVKTIQVNGRHFVVLLKEKKVASKTESSDIEQKIRQQLVQGKTQILLSGLVSELRRKIPIEYNNAVLQALKIK